MLLSDLPRFSTELQVQCCRKGILKQVRKSGSLSYRAHTTARNVADELSQKWWNSATAVCNPFSRGGGDRNWHLGMIQGWEVWAHLPGAQQLHDSQVLQPGSAARLCFGEGGGSPSSLEDEDTGITPAHLTLGHTRMPQRASHFTGNGIKR